MSLGWWHDLDDVWVISLIVNNTSFRKCRFRVFMRVKHFDRLSHLGTRSKRPRSNSLRRHVQWPRPHRSNQHVASFLQSRECGSYRGGLTGMMNWRWFLDNRWVGEKAEPTLLTYLVTLITYLLTYLTYGALSCQWSWRTWREEINAGNLYAVD